MALFRLNWEESKGGFTMCPILPNKILQDLSSKIPPPKKVPWHRRSAALRRGSTGHFCQKNAFFGQKKAFFQKVHFIQICSVTQNTVFQCFKNNFFLSQEKLIFFTILNLTMIKTTIYSTVDAIDLSACRFRVRDSKFVSSGPKEESLVLMKTVHK